MANNFGRLVEEYDAGTRCNLCREAVTVRGCRCRLANLYGQRQQEVLDWYEGLPAKLQNPRKGFRALPAVLSALTAERSKAGLHDLPVDPDNLRGLSVAEFERQGIYAQVGIDPQKAKWRKSDQGPARRPYRQRPGINPATAGGIGGRTTRPTTTVH